ncbi:hypothetical protein T12_3657 [Trichinella patagoniensis]|uniref:Uncharacterized protein n=1 Tax=Trichinella patagoniensis TaxID=990121 RepID=A0A0V0ZTB9_9BILA|nr:hypothetical protein T12_3657 [Trichinella patagoniensis]
MCADEADCRKKYWLLCATCGGLFCLECFHWLNLADQQQFVHWKRPHVRIPLVVDMVVCALLQSEQTRPYTALLVAVYRRRRRNRFFDLCGKSCCVLKDTNSGLRNWEGSR